MRFAIREGGRTVGAGVVSGNTVSIDVLIQEGNKKRIQSYSGKIISQHLAGLNSTITVRRLSKGIGIERIFPIHSPDIKSINLIDRSCKPKVSGSTPLEG